VSANGASRERDGISLATLVIAALASAAAAIVTSRVWSHGTVVTAAITPVIVALVKEGIQRPMQSEVVRRPVQALSSSRTVRRGRVQAPVGSGGTLEQPPPRVPAEPRRRFEPAEPGLGPVSTYGRPRPRRRWHIRAAILTGVIAFAIAAIVLTVPELLFGGAVASHGGTTFFSSPPSKTSTTKTKTDQSKTSTSGKSQTDTTQTSPPSQQPQGGQSTTTQPQSPPSQGAPPAGTTTTPAPVPSTPPTPTSP
jgi:hypothetical protein